MSIGRIAPKQRGRPFPKGHSGNPRGRPPGARNAATVLAEQLLSSFATLLSASALSSVIGYLADARTSLNPCAEKTAPKQQRLKAPLGKSSKVPAAIVRGVLAKGFMSRRFSSLDKRQSRGTETHHRRKMRRKIGPRMPPPK